MSNGTPKPVASMSDDEALAVLRALSKTEQGLEDAIDLLIIRKTNFATTEAERKLVRIELADLKADLAKVRARRIAFDAESGAMVPPSPAVVEEIKALARILDEMVADAEQGDAIVAAAEALLEAYQKTQA